MNRLLIAIWVVVATAALPVLANEELPGNAPKTSPWIAIVIAVVLILGVATGSFISSKRTHQD